MFKISLRRRAKLLLGVAGWGRAEVYRKAAIFIYAILLLGLEATTLFNLDRLSTAMADTVEIVLIDTMRDSKSFLGVYTLEYAYIEGRQPTFGESVSIGAISLLLAFFCSRTRQIVKPIALWLVLVLAIAAISALYFLLFPQKFPYTAKDFALFYTFTQAGIFAFIPLALGIALSVYSFTLAVCLINLGVICFTLFYAFLFGTIRYIVFLYALQKFSYLWMANLFFNFGPLVDIIYISGIYTYYLSILSKKRNIIYSIYLRP
jgi:hypothetical protein